jgi:hypothetical protein
MQAAEMCVGEYLRGRTARRQPGRSLLYVPLGGDQRTGLQAAPAGPASSRRLLDLTAW